MRDREQKRADAEERQAARAKRSDFEQLERLDRLGWAAKRERARLQARIDRDTGG